MMAIECFEYTGHARTPFGNRAGIIDRERLIELPFSSDL
jgi:hypothetical protein